MLPISINDLASKLGLCLSPGEFVNAKSFSLDCKDYQVVFFKILNNEVKQQQELQVASSGEIFLVIVRIIRKSY